MDVLRRCDLDPEEQAQMGYLEQLRHGIICGRTYEIQFQSAVLLIDLYEAILEKEGILIFETQVEEVTEH